LLRCISWNEELRLAERRRLFNVKELANLAAAAVQRSPEDLVKFEKLAEGGFNRTFLLSMRDGFQMVARIPYPMTEPKHLLVASEVATMAIFDRMASQRQKSMAIRHLLAILQAQSTSSWSSIAESISATYGSN
jgi:hypothetical protein